MAEKLFNEEIAEIKVLQDQLKKLNEDKDAKTAKIKQLKKELSIMCKRRDELEQILNQASSMLMDGRLSDDDYCNHKKELAALYQALDDKDSLLGIYEKAVDVDYGKKHAEINGKKANKRSNLIAKYSKKITFDIVNKSEMQLRQLLAILPVDPMRISAEGLRGLDLGNALIFALDHELDGTKKPRRDPDENKKLYQNVLNELGVES